ncbi:MAG: EamA family transporter [Thermodesulfobacteriota bacterium]
MDIAFALITAISYGLDVFFVRKGLLKTPFPIVAAFITLTINLSIFIVLFLIFVPVEFLKLDLIYIFILAGILAPGCARTLSYKGLETLGMSISIPIVNAESLFSVLMALIFLKEPMNLAIGTGILSVVTGIVLLSYETDRKKREESSKKIHYRYLFYPITASIFYGVSVFLRKLGLNIVGSPILGATLTLGTSWCLVTVFLFTSGNAKELLQVKKQSFIYFVIGGVLTCIGWLALFSALNIGKVIIVSTIATSYSLVTLVLSYLFLRRVERLSLKIVVATILIVGGVIVLSVAR